ncbi:transcriptional regulator, partial [Sphingomonas naasensis]
MTDASYRFERFILDADDRQLRRDGAPVDLNSRYLDALLLLVGAEGRLVSKDRFLDEVWRGVPVTDEALTQCIKTLRRQLGDDATRPRFIETVPKHGYRFVATVEAGPDTPTAPMAPAAAVPGRSRRVLLLGGAGTAGAGVAGMLGGLFYGFAAAAQPVAQGMGAVSVLLVLLIVTIAIGLAGGAGVAFGIAAAERATARRWLWSILGGAAGGLVVGAIVKLIGLDAFELLLGQSPGDFTGAPEGALLGGAVGLGYWLAGRETGPGTLGRGAALAALAG